MNMFDLFAFGTVGLFFVMGIWKGLIKQALSLGGVIAGWFLAGRFHSAISDKLPISNESIAGMTAFIAILLGCVIVSFLLIHFLDKIIKEAGLNLSNRLLGGLLGVIKGALIVVCASLFLVAALPSENKTFQNSISLPWVMSAAEVAGDLVPKKIKAQFEDKVKELKKEWKKKTAKLI